jgi:hypothetical protein
MEKSLLNCSTRLKVADGEWKRSSPNTYMNLPGFLRVRSVIAGVSDRNLTQRCDRSRSNYTVASNVLLEEYEDTKKV